MCRHLKLLGMVAPSIGPNICVTKKLHRIPLTVHVVFNCLFTACDQELLDPDNDTYIQATMDGRRRANCLPRSSLCSPPVTTLFTIAIMDTESPSEQVSTGMKLAAVTPSMSQEGSQTRRRIRDAVHVAIDAFHTSQRVPCYVGVAVYYLQLWILARGRFLRSEGNERGAQEHEVLGRHPRMRGRRGGLVWTYPVDNPNKELTVYDLEVAEVDVDDALRAIAREVAHWEGDPPEGVTIVVEDEEIWKELAHGMRRSDAERLGLSQYLPPLSRYRRSRGL